MFQSSKESVPLHLHLTLRLKKTAPPPPTQPWLALRAAWPPSASDTAIWHLRVRTDVQLRRHGTGRGRFQPGIERAGVGDRFAVPGDGACGLEA